jgi:hypothetical protein
MTATIRTRTFACFPIPVDLEDECHLTREAIELQVETRSIRTSRSKDEFLQKQDVVLIHLISPNVTLEVGDRDRLLADVIEESIFSRRERDDSEGIVALKWLDHARASTHNFRHALLDRSHGVQLGNSQTEIFGETPTRQLVIELPDRKIETLRNSDLPQPNAP